MVEKSIEEYGKQKIASVPVTSETLQAECQENNLGKPADRNGILI